MAVFDTTSKDAQAMPIVPMAPAQFDFAAYESFAQAAEARYAAFAARPEGIAVWQRVRVADVFRDGCRDMEQSLHWQLGGLHKSLDYMTDAPTYLEPWYGIGVTASAFGGDYEWPEGQAPVMRPLWHDVADIPDPLPRRSSSESVGATLAVAPVMRHVLAMIEYFLEETRGLLPMSWSDLQNPLNVATELVDTAAFFSGILDAPEKVRGFLDALTDEVIRFTQQQSQLIGNCLVQPGHGFASTRCGTGLGLSSDNLVMISPRAYRQFCNANDARIGEAFGGVAIHSCGDWARWLDAVKANPQLVMVDAAFTPQTDPDPNDCAVFRQAFAGSGVIVHARMVGEPSEVLERARQLWAPGMRLIIATYEQDPAAQHRLYHDIHGLCE